MAATVNFMLHLTVVSLQRVPEFDRFGFQPSFKVNQVKVKLNFWQNKSIRQTQRENHTC